jgi:hypothetical protein
MRNIALNMRRRMPKPTLIPMAKPAILITLLSLVLFHCRT